MIPVLESVALSMPAIHYEVRDVIHPDLVNDVLSGVSDIGIGVPRATIRG